MPSCIFGKIELDDIQLKKDLEIIKGFPRISEEYDEFGTGVWINNSLLNASQEKRDLGERFSINDWKELTA